MLYYGAGWLVKGSSNLAKSLGVTPLVIGLTVVAFGTSAPELFVSIVSSVKGKSMIAIGNVVGSNICNIALVLGVTALFNPVLCKTSAIKHDLPIMLCISLYLLLISIDSVIGRFDGFTLFTGIIIYSFFNYYIAGKKTGQKSAGEKSPDYSTEMPGHVSSKTMQFFLIAVGISGVILGAEIFIDSAVKIMKALNVNEKFIGLTIVAFGTSLPELATSVVSAIKKEMDISLGNLIGSNVFNILSVLGAASLIRPIPIHGGFIKSGLIVDYLVMIFISTLPWLMIRRDFTVNRKDGFILLCCYTAYIVYLSLYPRW